MSGSESILSMTVIAIAAGIVAQIAAALMGIPSIVPLLIIGIIVGPEVLGFLDPQVFGDGLQAVIDLSVAIILFEAGLNLEIAEIKKHEKEILRLITYGCLITMVLAALFSKLIIHLGWFEAFLFGSLVIVTGPTVIHPLLRRVRVESGLKNILESEAIFIDPIGAIIALLVYKLILGIHLKSAPGTPILITLALHISYVFLRLVIGTIIGAIGGFLVVKIAKRWSLLMEDFFDLFILAYALGTYAVSEAVFPQSGLLAAVVSGAIVGNMDIPEKKALRKFKREISTLVVSVLFILLAANLKLKYIISLGWGGILVVLALLYIVRPVEIFLATFGSDLRYKEKVFLSYICPRGIVAASVSSIFAIRLEDSGFHGGYVIQGLVFLTIGVSVLLQGITANSVARMLGVLVESRRAVIIGANAFGRLVGKLLQMNGKEVAFIDTNDSLVRMAYIEGFKVAKGNSLDLDNLKKMGISEADTCLAVTTNDNVNLFVSRLAKMEFGIKNVLPVLNRLEEGLEKEVITKLGLEIAFGKPLNIYEINTKIAHKEFKVFQYTVEDKIAEKKIEELSLPASIIPLIILRGKSHPPVIFRSDLDIQKGDKIVFLDINGGLTDLGGIGFKDYTQINVY